MTMNSHPELEQLSAYLDAEMEASERTTLEAHLPSCAECRSTLDALRATVTDLKELPEVEPTEQDRWALRSALSRARTPSKRWQRTAWAAGAVAAAAIAVVAIVRPGGGSDQLATRALNAEGAQAGGSAAALIIYDAGSFNAGSAQAKLLVLSGKAGEGQTRNAGPLSAPVAEGAPSPAAAYDTSNKYAVTTDSTKAIDRCVAEVKKSTQEFLRPVEYDVGTFESKPAFLLFFQTSSRYELWVVDQTPKCNVLFFAQAA